MSREEAPISSAAFRGLATLEHQQARDEKRLISYDLLQALGSRTTSILGFLGVVGTAAAGVWVGMVDIVIAIAACGSIAVALSGISLVAKREYETRRSHLLAAVGMLVGMAIGKSTELAVLSDHLEICLPKELPGLEDRFIQIVKEIRESAARAAERKKESD